MPYPYRANPIALLKNIKTRLIAGTREAMIRDGVALVRFFRWLEKISRQRQSNRNNSCRETASSARSKVFM